MRQGTPEDSSADAEPIHIYLIRVYKFFGDVPDNLKIIKIAEPCSD